MSAQRDMKVSKQTRIDSKIEAIEESKDTVKDGFEETWQQVNALDNTDEGTLQPMSNYTFVYGGRPGVSQASQPNLVSLFC